MAQAKKWLRPIVEVAESQGWRVEPTRRNHFQFKAPDGVHMVTTSGTPSDYRVLRNTVSQLRRAGLEVPPHFAK